MSTLYELVKDPYERKARLMPGLLVALPLIIPLVSVYGAKNPLLTSVIGLLSSCGAMFALANISRGLGKALEVKLVSKWGGMPTTIILRHSDNFLDFVTKERYHSLIEKKLGIEIPSHEYETENIKKADDIYIGAIRRLRELTRSNKGLLFKDNISYGFHRNMTAMKWVGIVTSLLGIVYGLIIANVLTLVPPHFEFINMANPGLAASLTLFVSVSLLASFLFYFNEKSVRRIGYSYAERLLECLPSLRANPNRK